MGLMFIHQPTRSINIFLLQIVIGSGPAGQKCAIDAVKRGYRVAMVDKNSQMGGVCVVCLRVSVLIIRDGFDNCTTINDK